MNDSPVWTGFKGDVPLKRAVSDLEADLVDHHARGYLDPYGKVSREVAKARGRNRSSRPNYPNLPSSIRFPSRSSVPAARYSSPISSPIAAANTEPTPNIIIITKSWLSGGGNSPTATMNTPALPTKNANSIGARNLSDSLIAIERGYSP